MTFAPTNFKVVLSLCFCCCCRAATRELTASAPAQCRIVLGTMSGQGSRCLQPERCVGMFWRVGSRCITCSVVTPGDERLSSVGIARYLRRVGWHAVHVHVLSVSSTATRAGSPGHQRDRVRGNHEPQPHRVLVGHRTRRGGRFSW